MRPDSLGETFARIKQIEGLLDRLMPEAAPTASPTPTSPGSFQKVLAAQLQQPGPAGSEANWLLPADPSLAGTSPGNPARFADDVSIGATDSRGWEKNLPSAAIARELLTGGNSFATRTTSAGPAARVPDEYRRLARQAARKYGVDEALVLAVIQTESNFNPRAVSRAGAMGLMQLMPANVTEYGIRDPFDPAQNVDAGVRHLRDMLQRYRGDVRLALAGYNAGPGNVAKYGGIPPFNETRNYIPKVLARAEAFRQAAAQGVSGLAMPGAAATGRMTTPVAGAAGQPALTPIGPMPVETFEQRPAPADRAADLPNLANREEAVNSATPEFATAPAVAPRSTPTRADVAGTAGAIADSATPSPRAANTEPRPTGAPDVREAAAALPPVSHALPETPGVASRPAQAVTSNPLEAPAPASQSPAAASDTTTLPRPAREPDAPVASPTATVVGQLAREPGHAAATTPSADAPATAAPLAPATPPHSAVDATGPHAERPPESSAPAQRTVAGPVELTQAAWQPTSTAAEDARPARLTHATGTPTPVPAIPAPSSVSDGETSGAVLELADGGEPTPATRRPTDTTASAPSPVATPPPGPAREALANPGADRFATATSTHPGAVEPLLRRVAERLPGVAALDQAVAQAVEPVRHLVEALGDALGDEPADEAPAPASPPTAVPATVVPEPPVRPRSGTPESQPGPVLFGSAAAGPVPAEAGQSGPDSDSSERHAASSETPRRAAPGPGAPVFTLEAPATPSTVKHATAPAPVVVDLPEQLTAELVRRVQVMRSPGRDEFSAEVRLPEAGIVSVRVVREAQTLHVSLTCDQPALRRELQSQLPYLESALRDQGLQLGSFDTATHQQQQQTTGGGYQPGPHPSPRYQLAEGADGAFRDTAARAAHEDDRRPDGQPGLTTWA